MIGPHQRSAPVAAVLALGACISIAAFVVALNVVDAITTPVIVGPPLNFSENQHAESALYVIAVVLAVPASMLFASRLGDALARESDGLLGPIVALAVVAMSALLLVVRIGPEGELAALAAVAVWTAGVGALMAFRDVAPVRRLLGLGGEDGFGYAVLAGVSVLLLLLAFCDLSSVSVPALIIGAAIALIVVRIAGRGSRSRPHALSRGARLALDGGILLLLAVAVPDLVVLLPDDVSNASVAPLLPGIINFHHDLWLGPTNEVLAGRPLLVDTASQYGIGSIYALAAWFHLAPIGYGTLGFLDGVAYALEFCCAYAILRIAGASRVLAASAMAVAVVLLVYNLQFPVGALPQHGPLRFGLPMLVILAATIEARGGRLTRAARIAQPVVVGIAAIWAFEALAYTLVTFAAVALLQTALAPRSERWSLLARRAGAAAAAAVAALVLLSLLTLVLTGSSPDFGPYLDYMHAFLFGSVAIFTYDYATWSAGLAVGAAYLISASGVVLLGLRRPEMVRARPASFAALAGCSGYGLALYTYFVDRSLDHVLPYVSLPLLLSFSIWLCLLMSGSLGASARVRTAGLCGVLSLAVLLLSIAFSSIDLRFPNSALGKLVPGGESATTALHELWHPLPLNPSAPAGVALLDRWMPGESRVMVLVNPALATEILLRSGRSNELPFTDPTEDSFVDQPSTGELREAVANLPPGSRALLQADGLAVAAAAHRDPGRDFAADPVVSGTELTPEQQEAVALLARRFRLVPIARDAGFVVVQLPSRRAG